jgi:S-adenosylmethionine hydrolase
MADVPPCVALVTDYGIDDTYAAALVGACWRVEPRLRCVSVTHGVSPGDVLAGAYHLKAAARAFPAGTVFCAVVDPEVGTERRAIAIETPEVRCVAPDNGLVTYLWLEAPADRRRCVSLPVPANASPTFHGRDLFAPVAARIACGASLDEVGTPVDAPHCLAEAVARVDATVDGARASCRIAVVDHFGNAITTLRLADLDGREVVAARWATGETRLVVRTYADIPPGEVALLVGSAGHVELAARRASAAALTGLGHGDAIEVELAPLGFRGWSA